MRHGVTSRGEVHPRERICYVYRDVDRRRLCGGRAAQEESEVVVSGSAPIKVMGRYALFREIAAGGMAVVHLGRLQGPVGFSRTVAIKRLYPQYARDPEFVSMFLDEARLAARVRHPNVVPTLDVVASSGELFLVMDYVHGESLARLVRAASAKKERLPPRVVLSIVAGALAGLHAAHEARDTRGAPLGIVHRDISPQNILVGSDGVARIVDFGVAKAAGRVQTTRDGQLKGKIGYFSPEQVTGTVTRKTDIFAMSIVLWEALTGRRLFRGENDATTLFNLLNAPVPPPSTLAPDVPPEIDAAVLRGLERDPAKRFETARDMALEIERHMPIASTNEISVWVERLAQDTLEKRAGFVAEVEGSGPDIALSDVASIMRPTDDDETSSGISGQAPLRVASVDMPPPSADVPVIEGPPESASRPPPAESTSLSHSAPLPDLVPQTRQRPAIWLWGIGAAAALFTFVVVMLTARHPSDDKRSLAVPPSASPLPAREHAPQPTPSAIAPEESEPTPSATTAPAAPSAAPAASAAAKPAAAKPGPRPVVKPVTKPAVAPGHCAVPYTLDAAGRKKWKPECL